MLVPSIFGEDFDNFLDNVYNNVDKATRKQIADLAAKNNWDFKVATEEYLASLAEDTNFERAMSQSWWNKIKFLFLEMLRKAGVKLDRTLRDARTEYLAISDSSSFIAYIIRRVPTTASRTY